MVNPQHDSKTRSEKLNELTSLASEDG